jgi:mannose-1-phosphate guanylyltransferase
VLLGVLPSSAETEYGWIEPGEPLAPGSSVRRVVRFVEKPGVEAASEMLRFGWLWNTLVVVAKVSHLIRLALTYCPETMAPLLLIRDALGHPEESVVATRAYTQAHPANLSRDLLALAHESLSVLELSGVTWSDLGTPRRVIATLARLGARPAWMTAQLRKELAPAGWAPEPESQEISVRRGSSGLTM